MCISVQLSPHRSSRLSKQTVIVAVFTHASLQTVDMASKTKVVKNVIRVIEVVNTLPDNVFQLVSSLIRHIGIQVHPQCANFFFFFSSSSIVAKLVRLRRQKRHRLQVNRLKKQSRAVCVSLSALLMTSRLQLQPKRHSEAPALSLEGPWGRLRCSLCGLNGVSSSSTSTPRSILFP